MIQSFNSSIKCIFIIKKKYKQDKTFNIKNSITNDTHPVYNGDYSKDISEKIMLGIGCITRKLSARLTGNVKKIEEIKTIFFECNDKIWAQKYQHLCNTNNDIKKISEQHTFDNPFKSKNRPLQNGIEYGYFRGWGIFDYKRDIIPTPGWGLYKKIKPRMTICYDDGILGVAIRYKTDRIKTNNTLRGKGTMYS